VTIVQLSDERSHVTTAVTCPSTIESAWILDTERDPLVHH
jgi:hypothetical protein